MKKLLLSTCFILCAQSAFSMEGEEKFNPFNVENFVFPQKNESYESYVGGEKKDYKPFEIKMLGDLRITVWYLFNVLEPNKKKLYPYDEIACECVRRIEDKNILAKTLFMALESAKNGQTLSHWMAAVECIKKIEDEKILTEALFKVLEADTSRDDRSFMVAFECIVKIKDEKILAEALFKNLEKRFC